MELIIIIIGVLNILKNGNNKILLLLSIEVIFIGFILGLARVSIISNDILGIVISFLILTLGAAESALGLVLIIKNLSK